MGFLDRFRTPRQPNELERVEPDRWDGSGINWVGDGVSGDRVAMAVEIASSPDFGVEPSPELDRRWRIALYDDVRGLVGDGAIEALPAWLEQQPGIDEVDGIDREIWDIRGVIDCDALARLIVARLATTADPEYWDEDDEP